MHDTEARLITRTSPRTALVLCAQRFVLQDRATWRVTIVPTCATKKHSSASWCNCVFFGSVSSRKYFLGWSFPQPKNRQNQEKESASSSFGVVCAVRTRLVAGGAGPGRATRARDVVVEIVVAPAAVLAVVVTRRYNTQSYYVQTRLTHAPESLVICAWVEKTTELGPAGLHRLMCCGKLRC